MATIDAQVVNELPYNTNKKPINKKALLMSSAFTLMVIAISAYYVPIIRSFGIFITLGACGYSIYNLNKVKLK